MVAPNSWELFRAKEIADPSLKPFSEEEVAVMVEKTQEICRKNKWDKTKHQNSETNIIGNPNALNDPSGQKRIKIVKMKADRDQNPDGSCSKVGCKKKAEVFQENLQNTSKVKNEIIENIVAEPIVNYELQKNYPSNNKTPSMRNCLSAELCAELCQSVICIGKSKIKPKVRRNIRPKMKPKTAR